jgi:hypothetical protein
MGENRSDFEARKSTENLKYVTQLLKGEEKKCPFLALVKFGKPIVKQRIVSVGIR